MTSNTPFAAAPNAARVRAEVPWTSVRFDRTRIDKERPANSVNESAIPIAVNRAGRSGTFRRMIKVVRIATSGAMNEKVAATCSILTERMFPPGRAFHLALPSDAQRFDAHPRRALRGNSDMRE